ncbi:MAG: LON peptidase substrate-binding domain-containing protein [Gammaproteobacteria bacterium]|nr:LON peptidase substrate-binding domain-containing protein [Gammaproteobacteria bacterium]
MEIPLFPLRVVLFDGGRLPLQIFETRYLDMVSHCMRTSSPFGVVLIRGVSSDARLHPDAQQPDIFEVGTDAEIVDFNQLSNGRLGIIVKGGRKFRVVSTREQPDHLLLGVVEHLPTEPVVAVGNEHEALVDILRELVKHPGVQKLGLEIDFADARSVGARLAELLPIEPEIKQSLLQLQVPRERLQELNRLVNKFRG